MKFFGLNMLAVGWLLCACLVPLEAADWPTWRANPQRTAATEGQLPRDLHHCWTIELAPTRPAWPEDERLHFDALYQPIVIGTTMFVSSPGDDSVTAFDSRSGETKWRFFAGGPVRFAPAEHRGFLYFGADDGYLYCVDAASGAQRWRVDLAPKPRSVLGNERLISVWPARGGVAIDNDKLHLTIGVWPFEGTFLCSLDLNAVEEALGGTVASNARAVRDALISTPLPTNLSPQGYLAATGERLYVPCGRSSSACFDVGTGRLVPVKYDVKGRTDWHLTALGPWLFHGERIIRADGAQMAALPAVRPVVTERAAYLVDGGVIKAYDLEHPEIVKGKDRRGREIEQLELAEAWSLANDQYMDLPTDEDYDMWLRDNPAQLDLLAGTRLYGRQGQVLFGVDLPSGDSPATLAWSTTIDGTPGTMLAADDRLFVVTEEGQIHCYADADTPAVERQFELEPGPVNLPKSLDELAERLLAIAGANAGYCLVWGIGDMQLIDALVEKSNLQVIVIDPDSARIEALRHRFSAFGQYGTRVTAVAAHPLAYPFPPYLANLVVVQNPILVGFDEQDFASRLFHVLRPYGGTACLVTADAEHDMLLSKVESQRLPGAQVQRQAEVTTLTRVGALPGSDDWTHEYGDAANSLMSRDELVKAPLGLLWFGGPSSQGDLYFDRHDWGPSMAVVEGRIFIQGPRVLSAVDVYTGRMLWQMPLRDGRGLGRRGNFTATGYHFVVVPDGIYLAYNDVCLWLDPSTGEQLGEFTLPGDDVEWGNIRVYDDLLVTSAFQKIDRVQAPVRLVALDRHSGEVAWTKDARFSYPFFAIGANKLFCFDGILEKLYYDMRRRGAVPEAASDRYLLALDVETGEELWSEKIELIVTWLGYAEERDILVASNKSGMQAHLGSSGQLMWQRMDEADGFGGHPESVWDKVILTGDRVIDQRGPGVAYYLETGEPITERHPITGEAVEWKFTRQGHHCNYAIANPHLLTFRSADAGFCDISSSGSSRLYGFRSGCRNSLLPAGGVLNAPNFAHGCICNYSLFTSLSLVHVPDAEMWQYTALEASELPVQRLGVNLGAPGTRRDPQGSFWLEHPAASNSSLDVPIEVAGEGLRWFREHPSTIEAESLNWVASSGVEGVTGLTLDLGKDIRDERRYTVRLYFVEPDEVASGGRTFNVSLQGEATLEDFDIVAEAGGPRKLVVREFPGVRVERELKIELSPGSGQPVLSGVEVIAERGR